MDFGTLKSRILAVIGRAPPAVVYELVTADINQEMRLRVMESTTTIVEAATMTLPTDFVEIVSVYRDTDPRTVIAPTTPQTLQRMFETSGTPAFYTIVDGSMLLSPSPSGSENVEIRYIASLSDLSADTDTNNVLTKYPSIYVYGALAHHSALIRDTEAAGMYLGAYEKAKGQARADDIKTKSGGSPIVPIVGTTP